MRDCYLERAVLVWELAELSIERGRLLFQRAWLNFHMRYLDWRIWRLANKP